MFRGCFLNVCAMFFSGSLHIKEERFLFLKLVLFSKTSPDIIFRSSSIYIRWIFYRSFSFLSISMSDLYKYFSSHNY